MPLNQRPQQGISEEEAIQQAEAQSAQTSAQAQEQIGSTAPPTSEPLDANRVNTVAASLERVADALGGGQAQLPPIAEVADSVEQLPPDLFAILTAVSQFVDQVPEAKRYAFDPQELGTSNKGLIEMAGRLDGLASDKKVQKAMTRPSQQEDQPKQVEPEKAPAPTAQELAELEK